MNRSSKVVFIGSLLLSGCISATAAETSNSTSSLAAPASMMAMHGQMAEMQQLMVKIQQEKNQKTRTKLLAQHFALMQKNMASMQEQMSQSNAGMMGKGGMAKHAMDSKGNMPIGECSIMKHKGTNYDKNPTMDTCANSDRQMPMMQQQMKMMSQMMEQMDMHQKQVERHK